MGLKFKKQHHSEKMGIRKDWSINSEGCKGERERDAKGDHSPKINDRKNKQHTKKIIQHLGS